MQLTSPNRIFLSDLLQFLTMWMSPGLKLAIEHYVGKINLTIAPNNREPHCGEKFQGGKNLQLNFTSPDCYFVGLWQTSFILWWIRFSRFLILPLLSFTWSIIFQWVREDKTYTQPNEAMSCNYLLNLQASYLSLDLFFRE